MNLKRIELFCSRAVISFCGKFLGESGRGAGLHQCSQLYQHRRIHAGIKKCEHDIGREVFSPGWHLS